MKRFLLMLLGKEINKNVDDSAAGVFKSECYYDWIRLKIIGESQDSSENSPEDLLVLSYEEEIKLRQEMIKHGLHVQQGIIALPTDDEDEENIYHKFLNDVNEASIIFISFINVPSWPKKEREEIILSSKLNKSVNVNEVVKRKILEVINRSSMRLFHTFDHNDFALICNGNKTELKDYLKTLEKIKFLLLLDKYPIVQDITTIYGYKSSKVDKTDTLGRFSAVVSVSGRDIFSPDILHSFKVETVGRYDHLSEYKDITWSQLSEMSEMFHNSGVIASRVHIGCDISDDPVEKKSETEFLVPKPSYLYKKFEGIYKDEIDSIDYKQLVEIYGKDEAYVDSIKLLLNEIGFSISATLRRGFSKYNSVCYIQPYRYFVSYIREKIIGKSYNKSDDPLQNDDKEELPELLVDASNSFYKSILTLDSSIMHNERRFIMSDPYQLTLFDVPPKLITYYTAVASDMVRALNGESNNKYVFLITPDIKKDIYVESITENRDIDDELNILVIHINERSIYNVTDTTKSLAHEIAHHVGLDKRLRKIRARHFVKCYISLLIIKCLDSELFSNHNSVNDVVSIVEKLTRDIFKLVEVSTFFQNINNYYYMNELKDSCHSFLIEKLTDIGTIDKSIYKIFSKHFDDKVVSSCVEKSDCFFADPQYIDLSSDDILKEYVYRHILESAYEKLQMYLYDAEQVIEDIKCILFIFKEGYADVQMILLTEDSKLNLGRIIEDYSKPFECVKNKTDEMMRKCSVINAFLGKKDRCYDNIANLDLIKEGSLLSQAYFTYICKQATLYFSKIRELDNFIGKKSQYNNIFECSKTSLFKTSETSEIIRQVDTSIESYVERIL